MGSQTRQEDLDFADVSAPLARSKVSISVKTEKLSRMAKSIGLKINANISKIARTTPRN